MYKKNILLHISNNQGVWLLLELFKVDKYSNIYWVDSFLEEFLKLVKEKKGDAPPYMQYQRWLYDKANVLDELGVRAISLKHFEDLKESQKVDKEEFKLYSIRYPKSKINVRVIFTFCDNMIILLHSFKEKSKKDYARAIIRSKNIIKSI